ncbi:MAG: hypothetical protein HY909_04675 [Deltaproteobacteria bacterium]|nr:hypothetical protein [Deltaproteobacteria bacterium]
MNRASMVSLAFRAILPLAGLYYAGCVVTGQAQARPSGTITVQGGGTATAQATTTAYAQPAQATVYTQPAQVAPPAVYAGGGVITAPPPSVYSPVGAGWMTTGYAEADYVAYNMTLRARQFAAGYIPVTDIYRSQMYQGQHIRVTVTASAGRCYRVLGVGGPGVQDLDLRLYDMNGNMLDQDIATDNFPVLGLQRPLCLNWNGAFVIDIHMYAGGGQIGVQAFADRM